MKVFCLILLISLNYYGWDSQEFKKPKAHDLKKILSDLQYRVTQEEGTERPFQNPFHDKKDERIYVDVISGEPLFSSVDKYDSGTKAGYREFAGVFR